MAVCPRLSRPSRALMAVCPRLSRPSRAPLALCPRLSRPSRAPMAFRPRLSRPRFGLCAAETGLSGGRGGDFRRRGRLPAVASAILAGEVAFRRLRRRSCGARSLSGGDDGDDPAERSFPAAAPEILHRVGSPRGELLAEAAVPREADLFEGRVAARSSLRIRARDRNRRDLEERQEREAGTPIPPDGLLSPACRPARSDEDCNRTSNAR